MQFFFGDGSFGKGGQNKGFLVVVAQTKTEARQSKPLGPSSGNLRFRDAADPLDGRTAGRPRTDGRTAQDGQRDGQMGGREGRMDGHPKLTGLCNSISTPEHAV